MRQQILKEVLLYLTLFISTFLGVTFILSIGARPSVSIMDYRFYGGKTGVQVIIPINKAYSDRHKRIITHFKLSEQLAKDFVISPEPEMFYGNAAHVKNILRAEEAEKKNKTIDELGEKWESLFEGDKAKLYYVDELNTITRHPHYNDKRIGFLWTTPLNSYHATDVNIEWWDYEEDDFTLQVKLYPKSDTINLVEASENIKNGISYSIEIKKDER